MKNIKLFWIDDMENWAKTAQGNLQIVASKYDINLIIIPAQNGEDEDIIQKIMLYDFNAIIMDFHMDPFNGDKYIRDIRLEEHLDHIPIIFYSQDNNTNLADLVTGLKNITTVYRPYLEDKIKQMFFDK